MDQFTPDDALTIKTARCPDRATAGKQFPEPYSTPSADARTAQPSTPLAGPGRDVIYWYSNEVPKHTDQLGVAEAEKFAAAAADAK